MDEKIKTVEWNPYKTEGRDVSIEELTDALLEKRGKIINGSAHKNRKKPTRTPRLVLSVIGDSSSFVPKPWLTQVFQLGLIETAKGAKDCLILYKGSEEKVSTLVWDAVDDFRVLNNPQAEKASKAKKKSSEEDDDETDLTFITLACLGPRGCDNRGAKDNASVAYKCYEIQDSRINKYQDFHTELLASIAKEYVPFVELSENQPLWMKVPVLVVVVEGDLQTLDHVIAVLKKNIPVLILQGTGKAADLIAEHLEGNGSIEAKAPLLFGIYFHEDDVKRLKAQITEIADYRQLVNIINIEKENETQFSDDVVNSIIRAWAHGSDNKNKSVVQSSVNGSINNQTFYNDSVPETPPVLVLPSQNNLFTPTESSNKRKTNSISPTETAVTERNTYQNDLQGTTVTLKNMYVSKETKVVSNNFMEKYHKSLTPASLPLYFYIAYQFIQEMPNNEKEKQKTKNFQILLQQAIIANRVDYVKVLLQEENVKFEVGQFPDVYKKTVKCRCYKYPDCQHIGSILQGASEVSTKRLIKSTDCQECIQAGRQLCQKFLHYPRKTYKKEVTIIYKSKKEIYQDLLIWALFANKRELATLFWEKCDNQLLAAILACCVLKRMAGRAKSGKDQLLHSSIKEHSSIFEKRALDLQTKLYEEDPEVAMDLMLTEQTVWDITVSPLECAFDNAMLDFIAHSCAQRRLNKIWYKKIGANLGDFWMNGLCCGCRIRNCKNNLRKFVYAPLFRFLVHYIIFLAAMVCYSAFLLIELSEYKGVESIKIYEWLIYVWLLGDILEEYRGILPWNNDVIRSRFSKKPDEESEVLSQSMNYRITRYFYDFWNSLDFISYCITIAAILVRFLHESTTARTARRLYSLSLFTMYMRFLHALLMSRKLGPKIIMIKEMLKDLFRFIGILFVFMVGVGVLYHANMYPAHYDMWNKGGWTYWRIWKIIYIPYWQIYGELFLDTFEEEANSTTPCTTIQSEWENDPEKERCKENDWVLIVIAALYLLISNLLLVNLVIALFSYRFEIVQANSERLWRYWRYAVVMDYRTRVPAPLNLIIRPFMSVAKCIKKCVEKTGKRDPDVFKRMERLQDISASKCIRDS